MEAVHCAVTQNSLKSSCFSEISGLSWSLDLSLVAMHVLRRRGRGKNYSKGPETRLVLQNFSITLETTYSPCIRH